MYIGDMTHVTLPTSSSRGILRASRVLYLMALSKQESGGLVLTCTMSKFQSFSRQVPLACRALMAPDSYGKCHRRRRHDSYTVPLACRALMAPDSHMLYVIYTHLTHMVNVIDIGDMTHIHTSDAYGKCHIHTVYSHSVVTHGKMLLHIQT